MKNTSKLRLLIVDDERNSRDVIARLLKRKYDVSTASNGLEGIEMIKKEHFDLVLSDIRMPEADGMELLSAVKKLPSKARPVVIMMTAFGSIEDAITATKSGAFYYITKPIDIKNLEVLLKRAAEQSNLKQENIALKQQLKQQHNNFKVIAKSVAMKKVLQTVEQIAPSKTTVLITGESGTGKELIAQALHDYSNRDGKFMPVHCAALSANLLESELFGYEKGAFTGAVEQRLGRFELANNGTLFLDEIGEIDPQIQVKLLRALESQTFERVGGMESVQTNARLVSATNRDLKQMVVDGDFREDLFYRLDVVTIHLPPLRERIEDIPLLLKHYLTQFAHENSKSTLSISENAIDVLIYYSWPGNIRELRNCVERMVVLTQNEVLQVEDIPVAIRENRNQKLLEFKTINNDNVDNINNVNIIDNVNNSAGSAVIEGCTNGLSIDSNEKDLVIKALQQANNNKTKAAELLGISRRTLHRKINKYNLTN
ncbi:sigma-54 dependent transcriptional regulator [Lentisphaerota bacterium WC36G]|nr:sigma-54 dependent transcriptional regulator [Lentisphaerae bacterium WC36]